MRTPKNFFNVGVQFKSHAYSIQDRGREGEHVTPEIVLLELEDFCRRIRRDLKASAEPLHDPEGTAITEQDTES